MFHLFIQLFHPLVRCPVLYQGGLMKEVSFIKTRRGPAQESFSLQKANRGVSPGNPGFCWIPLAPWMSHFIYCTLVLSQGSLCHLLLEQLKTRRCEVSQLQFSPLNSVFTSTNSFVPLPSFLKLSCPPECQTPSPSIFSRTYLKLFFPSPTFQSLFL